MKVTLVVATLNEVVGLKEVMPKVKPEWYDQLLILDGGSTDGTIEYARSMGWQVYVQKRKGLRHAYAEALPLIEGDVIVTFSPDGNCIPDKIPELVAKMKQGYDMVICSRYLDGAHSDDDDVITGFGNWIYTKTVNVLFGARYTDFMVIFRAYSKKLISDLALTEDSGYAGAEKLFQTHISWEPLLSIRAAKRGCKVTEIPGDEPKRVSGERKLQVWRWGAAFVYQIIRERIVN